MCVLCVHAFVALYLVYVYNVCVVCVCVCVYQAAPMDADDPQRSYLLQVCVCM